MKATRAILLLAVVGAGCLFVGCQPSGPTVAEEIAKAKETLRDPIAPLEARRNAIYVLQYSSDTETLVLLAMSLDDQTLALHAMHALRHRGYWRPREASFILKTPLEKVAANHPDPLVRRVAADRLAWLAAGEKAERQRLSLPTSRPATQPDSGFTLDLEPFFRADARRAEFLRRTNGGLNLRAQTQPAAQPAGETAP